MSDQEAVKQGEQKFLEAYASKNKLLQTLQSLYEARRATQQTLGERKTEFRNVRGLIEEVQAEDPSQKSLSFKEVVADPEGGSDEEKYVQSKYGVESAITELRKEKESLKALGVDPEGKEEQELETEVAETIAQKNKQVSEYARQHPESGLPEVQEVRQEMIAKREKDLEEKISSPKRILFGTALTATLSELDSNGSLKNLDSEDSYYRGKLAERLPRIVMSKLEASPEYESALSALSGDLQSQGRSIDTIDTQAFEGVIKKLLLNFTEDPLREGEISPIDPIQVDTLQNPVSSINILRRIYESFPNQSLKEFEYEDGELAYKARPKLASLFDGPDLQRLAQKSIERASLQGRIDTWDTEKSTKSRELNAGELAHETQVLQVSEAEQRLKIAEEDLSQAKEQQNSFQILRSKLALERNPHGENEQIIFTNNYNEPSISFKSDEQEYATLSANHRELVQAAQDAVANAEQELSQMPKKGFFEGQATYDARQATLRDAVMQAKEANTLAIENRDRALSDRHKERRSLRTKNLTDIASKVGIGQHEGTWAQLISKIDSALSEKISSLNTKIESLDMSKGEAESALVVKRANLELLTTELEQKRAEFEEFSDANKDIAREDLRRLVHGQ